MFREKAPPQKKGSKSLKVEHGKYGHLDSVSTEQEMTIVDDNTVPPNSTDALNAQTERTENAVIAMKEESELNAESAEQSDESQKLMET